MIINNKMLIYYQFYLKSNLQSKIKISNFKMIYLVKIRMCHIKTKFIAEIYINRKLTHLKMNLRKWQKVKQDIRVI